MVEIYKEKCTGCRACEKLCPKNAIEMREDEKGFLYPYVNKDKCINCGICQVKCPINNEEIKKDIKAYAAYNKDEEVRKQSSSGGLFTIFAEYVIENGGVVFGAAFDDRFSVEHIYIENMEDLKKLRGSKYVQSNTKDTYKEAKKFLENGKLVYYSGTPCQIEGLYAYLGKEYSNLITQDLICHGAPSPKVWEQYLKYKSKRIDDVNFRSKENSTWQDYEVSFTFENSIESKHHDDDTYMRLFLRDVILRDACYNCSFKKENRMADITLADFWGIDKVYKEINDKKGTSLLILNSKKAQNLIHELLDKIEVHEVRLKDAIKHNRSMIKSAKRHKKSEKVFELLKEGMMFEVFDKIENDIEQEKKVWGIFTEPDLSFEPEEEA